MACLALVMGCGDAPQRGARLLSPDSVSLQVVSAEELRALIADGEPQAVLVNMWATWCVPCREEFPFLLRLEEKYRARGLRVILVSWDLEESVAREYLAEQHVTFTTYLRGRPDSDPEFIEMFEPRWTGAFPATFVYDAAGQLRAMAEQGLTYEELEQMIGKGLNPSPAQPDPA